MQNFTSRFPVFGILLIIAGAILLLDRLDLLDIEFSQILWVLMMVWGISRVVSGFTRNSQGNIFWGTLLFLNGTFFFLHSLDSIEIYGYLWGPAIFLMLGIAFFMMFINNLKEWFLLIPSLLLGGFGVLLILADLGYLYAYEIWDVMRLYWPIALILIGVGIILRKGINQIQPPSTPVNP